MLDEIETQM